MTKVTMETKKRGVSVVLTTEIWTGNSLIMT